MRTRRFRTPRAWRRARRALVAVAATGLVLVALDRPVVGAVVFGAALVGLVLLESAQLRGLIIEGQRQQYALAQIRPLMGDLPLDLSGWAADPVLIHNAVRLIMETRPRLVVECGSGSSTVMIGRCLRALGQGRLISLEHDPAYARQTCEAIRRHALEEVATVVTVPLTQSAEGSPWYGSHYQPFIHEPIDVLLVDGPPGSSGPRARYPAVPLLRSRLAPECWILMDDGDRPDERYIAQAWGRELGAKVTYLEGGRGGWLLHRTAPSIPDAPSPA